jgi:hypothetical protein
MNGFHMDRVARYFLQKTGTFYHSIQNSKFNGNFSEKIPGHRTKFSIF